MATSSRRFQSQTLSRLVAGYRQVAHSAGQWLRRGRTAAVWGLQVAIYPIYAAVQGLRLGYRQLQARRPWQPLRAWLMGAPRPRPVVADLPIRALLSVVQPPGVASALVRRGRLRLVNVYGWWLQQSQAGAVLTPGQWQLIPFRTQIRGIASDLGDRRLVLVTTHNEIFAGLTADQQQRLQRAIVLMLAEYARLQRQQLGDRQRRSPSLPLPQTNPALVPPLRWLSVALRWMQTSPLAAATNLFGEASQPPAAQGASFPGDRAGVHRPRPWSAPVERSAPAAALAIPPAAPALALPATPPLDAVAQAPVIEPVPPAWPRSPVETAIAACAPAAPTAADLAPAALPVAAAPITVAGAPLPALPASETLEAQVVRVTYVDSPLALALRGLDWLIYAIETRLRLFWNWLRQQW